MADNSISFQIWVELEEELNCPEEQLSSQEHDEFCNAIIEFENGNRVGINIWSEKFFNQCPAKLDWFNDDVACGPDLVVRNFTIESIKAVLQTLITEENWLVGRGLPAVD